jgi:hypothetical protein
MNGRDPQHCIQCPFIANFSFFIVRNPDWRQPLLAGRQPAVHTLSKYVDEIQPCG